MEACLQETPASWREFIASSTVLLRLLAIFLNFQASTPISTFLNVLYNSQATWSLAVHVE